MKCRNPAAVLHLGLALATSLALAFALLILTGSPFFFLSYFIFYFLFSLQESSLSGCYESVKSRKRIEIFAFDKSMI